MILLVMVVEMKSGQGKEAVMKYRLEKLVDGNWWEEGTYTEGVFVINLVNAAFFLGRYGSAVDNVRVIILED